MSANFRGYLAGPINGCTDEEAKDWREEIKAALPFLDWSDPMDRDYREIEKCHIDDIVEGDKTEIANCEFMVVNLWKLSAGTLMEMLYAVDVVKIPVVTIYPGPLPVSPWISYHSTEIQTSVGEMIESLRTSFERISQRAHGKENP